MTIKITENSENAALLYNEICTEEGIFYIPLDKVGFTLAFCVEGSFFVEAEEGGALAGFAHGVLRGDVGYLSYVGVIQERREMGIGTSLVGAVEEELKKRGATRVDCVFHNPTHLPWYIPKKAPHSHPCAPGVDVSSNAYIFLKNLGYRDFTSQNSYYQKLSDYKYPEKMEQKRQRLSAEGIELCLYDPEKHTGLPDLFVDINNPGWGAQVLSNTDKPIVVAVDTNANNLVVSYTGPLSIEKSGRGGFCGIGTRHAYRGRGIGGLVFCEMCRIHSENGAKFMSLYTGEDNPARNIYEGAGFYVVRHWANMRKTLVK